MFHAADLLAGARSPEWHPTSKDPVAELLSRVRGRKRGVDIPNAPALSLSKDPKRLTALDEELKRHGEEPAILAAIAHVLTDSDVIFVGPAEAGGQRTYRLASVVLDEAGSGLLVQAKITQRRHSKPSRDTTVAVEASISTADEESARKCLRSIYLETERASDYILDRGRTRAPVAYWAGAPREEELPVDWEKELCASAAVEGYELRMDPEPGRNLPGAVRRLHDARPELVLLWSPNLASSTVHGTLARAAPNAAVREVESIDPREALEEAELLFEEATVSFELLHTSGPATVAEALNAARAETKNLVFLPAAEESAQDSGYVRPEAILKALLKLDAVAADYAAGTSGNLREACAQRGLNFASDISWTAKTQYRARYEVAYAGQRVLLGPHLRFGHGSPRTCARIYWYVDETRRRFVVGHVGKHLPDATGKI